MIKNPTLWVKVPVRFNKGIIKSEERHVTVTSINWKNETMEVEYEADMHDNGVVTPWTVTLSLEPFRKRFRI